MDEPNASKHRRVFEGFGGVADFPVLPPRSGWRRKLRALPRCCVRGCIDGDVAMAVTKCSPEEQELKFLFCHHVCMAPKKGIPRSPPAWFASRTSPGFPRDLWSLRLEERMPAQGQAPCHPPRVFPLSFLKARCSVASERYLRGRAGLVGFPVRGHLRTLSPGPSGLLSPLQATSGLRLPLLMLRPGVWGQTGQGDMDTMGRGFNYKKLSFLIMIFMVISFARSQGC